LRQAYDYWQNQPDCQRDLPLGRRTGVRPRGGRRVRDVETPRPGESWITILDSKSLVAEELRHDQPRYRQNRALGSSFATHAALKFPLLTRKPSITRQGRRRKTGNEPVLLFPACRAEKGPTFDPPRLLPSEDG